MRANTSSPNKAVSIAQSQAILHGSGDDLKNGIWPRSITLWMVAFCMAFAIIRPWEILIPSLRELRFERTYILCMIVAVFLSDKNQFRMRFETVAVLLFLGALALSVLFAKDWSLGWASLYQYLTIVIFYFVLITVIRNPYELIFLQTCYIVIMAVYLAKSQWEYFVNQARRYDMGVHRMWGIENTYGYPNALAQSIILSLPILLFLWSMRTEISCEWPNFWRKWLPRFLIIYFVLAVSSIIMTNSRIGMCSFIFFAFLVAFRGKGIGKKLVCIVLAVTMLGIFWQVMPKQKKDRFRTLWDTEAGPESAQTSADGRIEGLKAGITMFKRFPLTGVGLGNFNSYRARHVDGSHLSPHNLLGEVLGKTGLLGATSFLLLIFITLFNCRKVRVIAKSCSHPTAKVLSSMALAFRDSMLLLMLAGVTSHNLLRFNWLWIAAFAAINLDLMNRCCEEEKTGEGNWQP